MNMTAEQKKNQSLRILTHGCNNEKRRTPPCLRLRRLVVSVGIGYIVTDVATSCVSGYPAEL